MDWKDASSRAATYGLQLSEADARRILRAVAGVAQPGRERQTLDSVLDFEAWAAKNGEPGTFNIGSTHLAG